MCGITGFHSLSLKSKTDIEKIIVPMTTCVNHRGPDRTNFSILDNGFAMGHTRLSIQDLSEAGNQPMQSLSGRFTMVFNGEIYNHFELRKELKNKYSKKIAWRGSSDTETLLEYFEVCGIEKTLKNALGMFAFAIHDSKSNSLILARDRFGEKPLYYAKRRKEFIFCSELKSIFAFPNVRFQINAEALTEFFKYNKISSEHSILKDVYKIKPGCYLTMSIANNQYICETNIFWDAITEAKKLSQQKFENEFSAIDSVEKAIESSVIGQLISDVPLGSLLSGGIDSSIVTALMAKHSMEKPKTFTVGFKDSSYDESKYARAISKHLSTDHTEVLLEEDDCKKVIPHLSKIYDEPFADSSQIPTYFISKIARKDVKVVLTGDGADELFGGYNRYIHSRKIWKYWSLLPTIFRDPTSKILSKLPINLFDKIGASGVLNYPQLGTKINKSALKLIKVKDLATFCRSMSYAWEQPNSLISESFFRDINTSAFENHQTFDDEIENMMLTDTLHYLPGILCKVDRAAMHCSLETRAPFLDQRVFNAAYRTNLYQKVDDREGKIILKKILAKYIPSDLIDRPKSGFAIPVGKWIKNDLKEWTFDLLSYDSLRMHNLFNNQIVNKYLNEHLENANDHSEKLWGLLIFQSWYKEYNQLINT